MNCRVRHREWVTSPGTVRVFSLCAVGADRPGILAALARRLIAHGADVAESQVAILRGYTMLTLLVRSEDDIDPFALAADLRAAADDLGLAECALAELHEGLPPPTHQPSHIVSFYGTDQPGVLAGIATSLAEQDVNVLELQSRLLGNGENTEADLYVMLMEVAPPPGTSAAELDELLRRVAGDHDVEVALAPIDEDES